MRFATGGLLLVCAVSLRADSFGDMKAALAALRGTARIQAALEIQRTEIDRSKKPAETTAGGAAVDALVDGEGLHIAYTPALLARVAREQADRQANNELHAPTARAVAELGPLPIAERLDFGRILLGMLGRAAVVSEKRLVYEGRPARLLTLKLNTLVPKSPIGHVELLEDSMNIWIGDDNIPLAAQRTERYTGGILFIKAGGTQANRWAFTHKDDRLVATRTETKNTSSGFGENRDETEIVTLQVK